MRLAAVLAVVLLASALPSALALGSESPAGASSYIVLLKDQRSHDASLATRAVYETQIEALVAQRTPLVRTWADLSEPTVLELSSRIDALLGEMRVRIAADASRLHAPTRTAVESYVGEIGGVVTYRSPLLNLLAVRLPDDRVDLLRAHPLVASVEPDLAVDFALDISVPATGAPSFWGGGFTGGPFELVVPDTGVDASHPALVARISDAQTFHDAARFQGDYADNFSTTDDLHGHGTHIAGIVASQDATYRGVAYGMLGVINAKFGYLTNVGGGRGIESDSMKAMDWAILTAGGDVLSLSFGGGPNDNGESGWGRYMDALVDDLGIPVSVAAGNGGPGGGTLGIPATSYNIMTVGAIDDQNTVSRADDAIAAFSSRGPTGDNRQKPDIAAPGSSIVSAAHDWEVAPDFVAFWGTSMAAPHVGAGFLLYTHAAGAPSFPARSKAVFLNTAQDLGAAGWDTAYGWGSMDLAQAWTYRNAVVEGRADEGVPVFYRISGAISDRVTLVWQKHVVYNGISYPNTFYALNNLDLNLYDELGGNRIDQSARTRDNVEQVEFPSATTAIAKVFVVGALGGVPDEPFALAAKVTPVALAPPSLAVSLSAPSQVDSGQTFVVTANVTNTGGLRVSTATVTLTLPGGVTLVSGANPASLGGIPAGTTRTATWTVTSSQVGTHAISAGATASAWEETYVGNGGPIQVTVRDVSPPLILNHGAVPSPQNVGGVVNVSAAITDNVGVTGAWVSIVDPLGGDLGNASMLLDPITSRHYYARPYAVLGRYDYTLWTRDAAGNFASASGAFQIADLEAPVLAGATASPNPQEVHFSVNVTAAATDNVGVWIAYLEVADPLGGSTNVTMSRVGTTVYLERAYDLVGVHTYVLSVRDAAWNWASTSGAFTIRDTTAPLADGGPDRMVEAGTTVLFDASNSTDNVGIVSYAWSLVDGGPVTYVGVTATHRFLNIGSFVVTLTVRDAAGNTATDAFTVFVVDARPPDISDVRADPPVQDVGGTVRISAVVYDEFGLAGVWVRVVDPTGGAINVTMTPSGGRYANALTYRLKGSHLFEIWASDRNNNWASARGAFEIADLSPPVVTATAASPQDVFAPVDVTATVVENDALAGVTLTVRDPFGTVVAEAPMTVSGGTWRGTFTPSVLGVHAITVWATDVSGNLGKGLAAVLAVDREPPTITANVPGSVEVLGSVDFDLAIADNLGAFVASLEVKSPSGASLGNRTLFGGSPYSLTHRFDDLGPFPWRVYAVDPSGNAAVAAGVIQVVDSQPPVADAGPDRTVLQGTFVPLDGSGSSDNFGIESYTWTFTANGRAQTLRAVRETFAFRQAGSVTVRLIVTDFAGHTAEDTATITVAPADTDADGMTDDEEATRGTNPNVADTDADGQVDGSDADPLAGDLNPVRLFSSWWGVLLLFLIFLVILAAGIRRRRKGMEPTPPTVRARSPPRPPPELPLPPPPTD